MYENRLIEPDLRLILQNYNKKEKFYSFPSKVKFKDLKLYLTIYCTE